MKKLFVQIVALVVVNVSIECDVNRFTIIQ